MYTSLHPPIYLLPPLNNMRLLTLWLTVYIESWSDNPDKAVGRVCDVLDAVLSEWIKPLAPSMTYAKELFTSSSHLYGRSLAD